MCLTAPSQPPAGVKVTLIEEDTALVSWREPEEHNVAVTHYTILYASQRAWLAGHWQVLQREGEEQTSVQLLDHYTLLSVGSVLQRVLWMRTLKKRF